MQASTVITRAVGWAVGVFQVVESTGGPIPAGPVLVVANHPNALLDPLLIFRVAGRPTRPLAKAPLFDQKFIGTMLRGLGGLPVYRTQDDPTQMHRNEDTFRGAIAALRAGDAVQIFPEGKSHSEPSLEPMRTGAARIALGAEAESGWTLGLRVVPVGITYRGKNLFRGRALAVIGEPFDLASLRATHDTDPVAAVRALTEQIAERLAAVTFNVAEHRDAELIDAAERLYVREKRKAGWRERDPLAERLPRLRAFAEGLQWLRVSDPERHARLARTVSRYRRRAALLGVQDGDVPPRYTPAATTRYVMVQAMALLLLAVPALIGTVLWYPAWLAPHLTLRLVRPDFESIATYKLATGFVMVPLTMALTTIAGALAAGWRGALAALVLVPLCGLIALKWHERRRRVAEDTTLFLRVVPIRRHQERLAADRAALTAEFDELVNRVEPAVTREA